MLAVIAGLLEDYDFPTSLSKPKGGMSPRGIFQSPIYYVCMSIAPLFFMLPLVFSTSVYSATWEIRLFFSWMNLLIHQKKTSKQTNKLHPKESQQQKQIRMNTTATPEGEEGLAVVCRERPELSPLL